MKIIKITSLWCPSCIIMNNLLDKINPKTNIISYDYDMDELEITKYNIGKILPVFIKINDNEEEVGRLIGEKKQKELEDFLGE